MVLTDHVPGRPSASTHDGHAAGPAPAPTPVPLALTRWQRRRDLAGRVLAFSADLVRPDASVTAPPSRLRQAAGLVSHLLPKSIDSHRSFWSYASMYSFASISSLLSGGSVLSAGSMCSILSIGSAGSVLSIGSAGSVLSIGSVGSVCAIGKAGVNNLAEAAQAARPEVRGAVHLATTTAVVLAAARA